MSPGLAAAMLNAEKARECRERAAARGKCPTCRDLIPGLEPVESRPRPWKYCEACKREDRERKRDKKRSQKESPQP